jgi:16S rRNA (guanine527-N7)-methyltransferase
MQSAMAHLPISQTAIAGLLTPFLGEASLSEHQMHQVSVYLELLLRWNERVNLTAVRDPEEVVTRHFGECFFAACQLFPRFESSGTAIDIGSGAGFPGLPIRIFAPNVNMMLIESNNKKVAFLREVARSLGLANVNVLAIRAEEVKHSADLVTFRAVERFQQALPIAGRLAESNGRVALLIGGTQQQVAESLLPDISWGKPIPVPLSLNRVLAIGHKQ